MSQKKGETWMHIEYTARPVMSLQPSCPPIECIHRGRPAREHMDLYIANELSIMLTNM